MPRGGVEVQSYSFFNLGARWGVGDQRHAPAALAPGKKAGTHCTGDQVGRRACMEECGNFRSNRDSMPVPFHTVASRYTDYVIPPHTSLG